MIVGGSTSAIELSHIITNANKAKSITLSQHNNLENTNMIPKTVNIRPDVKRLTENGVEFVDETFEKITTILYCTGMIYCCVGLGDI